MAIIKRRPTGGGGKQGPQQPHPALRGQKPLSPIVKRRPKGK